jgi:hypothetical protein
MQADHELERWQRQWQSQPAVPIDLRRRVERDMRGRRLALLASIAVTVVIGGGTSLWAARSGESAVFVLAFAVWIFIAIAWGLTIRLERLRGPSRPLTNTTSAFLDYAIRTRRMRRQGITASAILYVVFFGFMLIWRYRAGAPAATLTPWEYVTSVRIITLLAISVALGVLAIDQRRRLDRELRNLVTMRDDTSGVSSGANQV